MVLPSAKANKQWLIVCSHLEDSPLRSVMPATQDNPHATDRSPMSRETVPYAETATTTKVETASSTSWDSRRYSGSCFFPSPELLSFVSNPWKTETNHTPGHQLLLNWRIDMPYNCGHLRCSQEKTATTYSLYSFSSQRFWVTSYRISKFI